jgi:adenylate kinase
LVLLGPPGVGKGTQGRRLAQARGWALISTGEILRTAIAQKTALGLQAQKIMDGGHLVGDDVMIGLVRDRIAQDDARSGFVLDGFPRTIPQAEALDRLLDARGQRLDGALSLMAEDDELVRRLSARRECPVCKRAYNLSSSPQPRDGVHCDDHAVELIRRADDAPETVSKRLEVYRRQTAPLLDYYRGQGRLSEIPGLGSVDQVYAMLETALTGLRAARPESYEKN